MDKHQHADDVASLLPLYLEVDALDLYMEMKEEDQKDISLIEARFNEAFTDDAFTAYNKIFSGLKLNLRNETFSLPFLSPSLVVLSLR